MVEVRIKNVSEPVYTRKLIWRGTRNMTLNDMPYTAEVRAFTRKRVERKLSEAVWYHPLASRHLRLDDERKDTNES